MRLCRHKILEVAYLKLSSDMANEDPCWKCGSRWVRQLFSFEVRKTAPTSACRSTLRLSIWLDVYIPISGWFPTRLISRKEATNTIDDPLSSVAVSVGLSSCAH